LAVDVGRDGIGWTEVARCDEDVWGRCAFGVASCGGEAVVALHGVPTEAEPVEAAFIVSVAALTEGVAFRITLFAGIVDFVFDVGTLAPLA